MLVSRRYKLKNNCWRTDAVHLFATVTTTDEKGNETVEEDVHVPFHPSQALIDLWESEAKAAFVAEKGEATFDRVGTFEQNP